VIFEGISKVIAGQRNPEKAPALEIEGGSLADHTDNLASESVDDEIFGEFDDPPDEIEDDPLRIQREPESADVIDVEIEVVEDAGYTDAGMSHLPGTATPDDQDQSLSVELSGPLGMTGPVGSGLMSLSDAVEAQAEKRAGEAARVRDTRWC
jgi:hypothetical protein